MSRWIYSLTDGELDQIFTNLELRKKGTSFDNMMRLQRELLANYVPADFLEKVLEKRFSRKNYDCC